MYIPKKKWQKIEELIFINLINSKYDANKEKLKKQNIWPFCYSNFDDNNTKPNNCIINLSYSKSMRYKKTLWCKTPKNLT